MDSPNHGLSPSEKTTLAYLAGGEHHASELDWVALQRLKQSGLAEEQSTGPAITKEGRRVLHILSSAS